MKNTAANLLAIVSLAAIGGWTSLGLRANTARADSPSAPAPTAQIERGRYLVESVGLCADCHTPRTEKGAFDRSRWLAGAPLPFQPTIAMPWSPAAPPIAGLPTMTDEQGIEFMQTGRRPSGAPVLPPMPAFRFNPEDAAAVVAYLKSLGR